MKGLLLSILSGMSVLMLAFFEVPAFGMDFILGARGGFFFWRPFYKDLPAGAGFEDIRTGHGGLYGPIISIGFTEKIYFSVSGLFGEQTTQWHSWGGYGISDGGEPYQFSLVSYVEARRSDIDSAVSYAVTPEFRFFIGYKFQYMKVNWYKTARYYSINQNQTRNRDEEFEFTVPLNGVAIGCNYAANLTDLYFFSVNISGVYTRGLFQVDQIATKYNNTGLEPPQVNEPNPAESSMDIDVHQYGVNFEPSLGIRTSGPLIAIGLRYQLLRTQFYNLSATNNDGPDDRWMNDHLYGVFVSVMYVL